MSRPAFNIGPVTQRSMPFWCVASPLADPFGDKVMPSATSVDIARILCWAAGEGLIECTGFHDDDLVPWDPEMPEDDLDTGSEVHATLQTIKGLLDEAGLTVNTATCSLHGNPIFRKGGITNPDPAIRDLARQKVERTIRIGHLLGAKYFTYWVARDGFEVPVTVDWSNVYGWLADGLDHVCDYIREQGFTNYVGATVEPKPNEPRGHMFLPTAGHAVGLICGRLRNAAFWGVNPELLQHESMTLMNAVLTLSYLVSVDKLSFLHFGSQIKGQFDNDFPPLVGPEGLKETAYMFWALRQMGWQGVVEFDCHMLRTEGDADNPTGARKAFIRNCVTALSIALQLADRIPAPSIGTASETVADLAATMALCALDPAAVDAMTVSGS